MLNGKSHTCIHTQNILGHDMSVWSIMENSSFLLLYFFHLFLSFSLFYFFFRPPFLWIFFRVIYYRFCTISSIHMWVRYWESFFLCSPSPLLEPSTLSCKATYLLFRHHLHINAVRELARQHLMRGWQYFLIFVFPHFYPLSDIFISHLLQNPSETLP